MYAYKLVFAATFIRTLKNKISKYMMEIPKNECTEKLLDIMKQYNNKISQDKKDKDKICKT